MIRSFQKSCPALTLSLAALFSPHAGLAAPVAPEPGFVIASLNGSGAPNKAFSGDGVLLVGSDSCSYIDGRDIAFSADRLYVTGPCAPIGNWQGGSFVLKLLKDGSVDTTFGEQGLARVPGISAAQIVVDAGRPIVAGSGNGKFVVARLKTNGSLDTTFGSGGISVVDAPSVTGEYLTGMARQSDGKIVLVGTGTHSSLGSLFVTGRLTTAGAPDTSFSADGWDNTDFAEGTTDKAYDVAIGGDGKIVVAGYSWLAGGSDRHLAVVRYTTNGTKDSTFSVDGKATVQVPGASLPAANGVAVDSSGRVVLGGVAWFPDGRFAVGRLTSSGALD
ncbi:MAG: hypothetical protein FJ104_15100, partial [Deltaproteobacteria bacterium]|nr:hypothetical protein [Deltaproteobacteria bacterium]